MTRIIYFDMDSTRPDHLGCYGYHRNTSPNIDQIASQGVRFTNCYASDAPCLPSRTALFSGRFGIHTGVIDHGGIAGEPFIEGPDRKFSARLGETSFMACLENAGYDTVTISSFGSRHSAWHWYAGWTQVLDPRKRGMDIATDVAPIALDWIKRNATRDDWFLHVHFWDPHQPYRTPTAYGEPFKDDPIPGWLTEDIRQQHWNGYGPQSAQEVTDYAYEQDWFENAFPRQPHEIASMDHVRQMFDGYDTGVRFVDDHIGQILNALADQGVLDDTVIVISADHGECLGEFNIYGGHRLADQHTTNVPLIIRWPGITDEHAGRVDTALHYSVDWAATVVDMITGEVPDVWDGQSLAEALKSGVDAGREFLVVSQGAVSAQRAVRFDDYLCIRTYHGGHHEVADLMLFDLKNDPHELNNVSDQKQAVVNHALSLLEQWTTEMMLTATHPQDPMWHVIHAHGALHARGHLPNYLDRLKKTGRNDKAKHLEAVYAKELEAGIRTQMGG